MANKWSAGDLDNEVRKKSAKPMLPAQLTMNVAIGNPPSNGIAYEIATRQSAPKKPPSATYNIFKKPPHYYFARFADKLETSFLPNRHTGYGRFYMKIS